MTAITTTEAKSKLCWMNVARNWIGELALDYTQQAAGEVAPKIS